MEKKITREEIRKAADEIFNKRIPQDPERRVKLRIFCETPEEAEIVAKYWNNLFKEAFLEDLK